MASLETASTALEVAQALAAGCDLEKKTDSGRTPLSLACERGNLSVVQSLVRHGAT